MNKLIFVLVILLVFIGATNVQAQTIVQTFPVISGTRVNSAGDTSSTINVLCGSGLAFVTLNSLPDSIVIVHSATKDSVASDIYYLLSYNGTNFQTAVAIDSIKSGAGNSTVLTKGLWSRASAIKIAVVERAAGNAVLAANKANFFVTAKKYFTQSPQWK